MLLTSAEPTMDKSHLPSTSIESGRESRSPFHLGSVVNAHKNSKVLSAASRTFQCRNKAELAAFEEERNFFLRPAFACEHIAFRHQKAEVVGKRR